MASEALANLESLSANAGNAWNPIHGTSSRKRTPTVKNPFAPRKGAEANASKVMYDFARNAREGYALSAQIPGRLRVMTEEFSQEAVNKFLLERIDSVPHLEALLLLWHERFRQWTADDIAKRLFVPSDLARNILQDLVRQNLAKIAKDHQDRDCFEFGPGENESMVNAIDVVYRRELVRISNLIHSKASAAVREFARAFRITKERE